MTTAIEGITDLSIYDAIAANTANVKVIVGIDAPLSYNPGGGDRKSDGVESKIYLGISVMIQGSGDGKITTGFFDTLDFGYGINYVMVPE